MSSRALILLLIAAALCSCSTRAPQSLDLASHPELPSARLTHAMRHVAEHSKFLRKRAIWGNYGGPGCIGGVPIDQMDRYFLQHDLGYLQCFTRKCMIDADRTLISQLESLDPTKLTPEADEFRLRAIKYFKRPISRVLGKPPDVLLGIRKHPAVIDISDEVRSGGLPAH